MANFIIYPFMFVTIGFLSIVRGIRNHPKKSIMLVALAVIGTFTITKSISKSVIAIPVVILVAFFIFGTLFLLVNVSSLVARFMCYIHNYDVRDF